MALTAGTHLGPYEILAPIGAGGMGEVYRARDTKLKRDVALKVLPDSFARDPERMARFQREAEVLASLNHPNIAQIYGVEERGLVMELVPGEPLKGPLPLETALNYAKQIADALEAAHEKNIIHRDLKPANIMVTPTGVVKVLDFGLAAVTQSSDPSNPANSPTLTISPTRAGMILGTAAYMSPEQARGKAVDKRADIWAFGVVLYEMLTGQRLFEGEAVSDTLAQVLTKEPDWEQVPAKVRRLLKKCLEKDPKRRLRDIGDVWELLEGEPPTTAPSRSRLSMSGWIAAGMFSVVAVALLALGFLYFHRAPEDPRVLKFSVYPPEKEAFYPFSIPAVSPDGRHLAFVTTMDGKDSLWVRDLDSTVAHALPGTESAFLPFWSPEGRVIGFFVLGKLKKVDLVGGPALTLCDAPNGVGATWSKNDIIVFGPDATHGLFRVPAAGGAVTPVTVLDLASGETDHSHPWFLPDGHHFLYTANSTDPEKTAVYIGDLDSKSRRRLLTGGSNTVYASPGYLLFQRERTLMGQRLDAANYQLIHDPVPIAQGVDQIGVFADRYGLFSASQNGTLVYSSGNGSGSVQLTWFDRSGKVVGTVGTPAIMDSATISPNGSAVAIDRLDPQTGFRDIWLHDLKRGTALRLTFNEKTNDSPIWSPDASHIVFSSTRDGVRNLYQKATSGAANEEALVRSALDKYPTDWSRSGRYIFYDQFDPKGRTSIWVLPLFGDRKPFLYLRTNFNDDSGRLSPDGRWLAYVSDETKQNEIYVQTFPNPGAKYQVSSNGGGLPVWSADGKELFFIGSDRKLMVAEVKAGPAKFEANVPEALFGVRTLPLGSLDVGKGGNFLLPTAVEQSGSAPMTVVVNWQAALKE